VPKRAMTVAGAVALALAALSAVFLVGMRRKSPPVVDTVRRVNRAFFNPRQMASAGTPGAYAAVIRHRGRTSGTAYETPVGAVATDDGFVIGLVYGPRTDWLRNVLAAGGATVVHEGRTVEVDRPEVVPTASMAAAFGDKEFRNLRLFGVDQCLQVHRADAD
jgi:deazaflavin-dependent oxidoreductase (nitroreductase family)